jgi:hypothetical protein
MWLSDGHALREPMLLYCLRALFTMDLDKRQPSQALETHWREVALVLLPSLRPGQVVAMRPGLDAYMASCAKAMHRHEELWQDLDRAQEVGACWGSHPGLSALGAGRLSAA